MFRIPTSTATLIAAGALVAGGGSAALASGSDPSNGTSMSATGGKAPPIQFAQCMRANGVPGFPAPTSAGGGGLRVRVQASQEAGSGPSLKVNGVPVDAPAFKSAMDKCRQYLPNGGVPNPQDLAKIRAGAFAMARCMRAHGVPNFPDPSVSTGPGNMTVRVRVGGPGLDPTSPAFQVAAKVCKPLFSAGP